MHLRSDFWFLTRCTFRTVSKGCHISLFNIAYYFILSKNVDTALTLFNLLCQAVSQQLISFWLINSITKCFPGHLINKIHYFKRKDRI